MQGKFSKNWDNKYMDAEESCQQMKHSGVKGETEELILAAQYKASILDTTASSSQIKLSQINVGCVTVNLRLWSISYQGAKC